MTSMKEWLEKLNDPSRDVFERRYRLLSLISIATLTCWLLSAWAIDGYSLRILFFGIIDLLFIPTMIVTLKTGNIQLGAGASGIVLVFLMLPFGFFFNGGIHAGAPNWCIIALIFVTLTIRGKLRQFLIVSDFIITTICYIISWKYPELVDPFTPASAFTDSVATLVIPTIMTISMFMFQLHMANQERETLEKQRKEIVDLSRAQNRFFSSMSHEIRTPVNTIIGLNEMILREDISDEVAEDAGQVRSAGKMLLLLINDILDMSKLESGRMELSEEPYSIGDLLSEVVGMMWIHAKEKGLEFHINTDPSLPARVYGDEMRVRQILINVLNNAIKYTKKGSVTLSISEQEKDGRAAVVYEVSDTGSGIRKESMPYLFSAFRRVESDDNKNIEGTGLGLAIVKQLVDLMGGEIGVSSIYGQGSTFTISLPEKRAGDELLGEIDVEKRHSMKKRNRYVRSFTAPRARVLVVDDNAANLMVAVKLLRDTEITVDTAASGAEALKMTTDQQYDLIFMDHLMPEMDGVECMEKIRTQTGGLSREAGFVALTANVDSGSRKYYADKGFDAFLAKPVAGSELEQMCIRLLPQDKVKLADDAESIAESSVEWMRRKKRREDLIISTDSIADIPEEMSRSLGIVMIPHAVHTPDGIFRDGKEIDAQAIVKYLSDKSHTARALPPERSEYEAFYAGILKNANNLIHISISSKIPGSGCGNAVDAADSFQNVTVIDSGLLSSGEGLLALEAARLVREGAGRDAVLEDLKKYRKKIRMSFVVDSLNYMARSELVSARTVRIFSGLLMRPVLRMREGELKVSKVYLGSRDSAWKRYIRSELRNRTTIDSSILFITHVGLSQAELESIQSEVAGYAEFRKTIVQKASPAIAANCGPGTFGLLYLTK